MQTHQRSDADTGTAPGGRAGPWVHTATLGLLLMVGTALMLGAGVVVDGVLFEGDLIPFLAVLVALLLCGAALAWSGGRRRLIVAVAIAGLVFVAFLGDAVSGVTKPGAFLDFAPNIMFLVGAPLAIGAGTLAVVRHGQYPHATLRVEQRVQLVVLAGLAAALLISAVLAVMSRTTVAATDREGAAEVVAERWEFEPSTVDVVAGGGVVVRNADVVTHTFTVDELGIDVEVGPGSEVRTTLAESAPVGTYAFYCIPHSEAATAGREGMIGTLTVS